MKLIIFLTFCMASLAITEACTCLPLPQPRVCNTQFLMLVKITGAVNDRTSSSRKYTFNLIKDISYPSPSAQNFTYIEAALEDYQCPVVLGIGHHYLLGLKLKYNSQLQLIFCESFVQEWTVNPCTKSDPQLDAVVQLCEDYRNSLTTSTTTNAPDGTI